MYTVYNYRSIVKLNFRGKNWVLSKLSRRIASPVYNGLIDDGNYLNSFDNFIIESLNVEDLRSPRKDGGEDLFQSFHAMGFTRGSRLIQGLRFNPCDPQFQAIGRTNLILPVEVIPAPNV